MKIEVTNLIERVYSFEIKTSTWETILRQAKKEGYEVPDDFISPKRAFSKFLIDIFQVPRHCSVDCVESTLPEHYEVDLGLADEELDTLTIQFSEPTSEATQEFTQQQWGIGFNGE